MAWFDRAAGAVAGYTILDGDDGDSAKSDYDDDKSSCLEDFDRDDEHNLLFDEDRIITFDSEDDSISDTAEPPKKVESAIVNIRKLSAIFQFAKAMPVLFVPASHIKKDDNKKRKRGNVQKVRPSRKG